MLYLKKIFLGSKFFREYREALRGAQLLGQDCWSPWDLLISEHTVNKMLYRGAGRESGRGGVRALHVQGRLNFRRTGRNTSMSCLSPSDSSFQQLPLMLLRAVGLSLSHVRGPLPRIWLVAHGGAQTLAQIV